RLSDELRASGVPVYLLGPARLSRPWTVWQARRRLRRVLNEVRPDRLVGHSCWSYVLSAPVAQAPGVPLVFCAHGTQTGKHWLERWARRTNPDMILANSHFTEASVRNLFPDARAAVWYCTVAPSPSTHSDSCRRKVRAALDTPEDAVVIVQASRLEPWKGHQLLLEALAKLAPLSGWVCWIAGGPQLPGEDAYLAELRQPSDRLGVTGRVRWLGQRSDVPSLLAAADIHCQPNTGPEPFGIAFIEALYAGLPVVTTAIGGPMEIINDTCGVLVAPG